MRTSAIAVAVVTIVLAGTWMALQFKTFEPAFAQSAPFALNGYAWSETVGWLSMSGTTSGGQAYGVSIGSDMNLTGYAWSENIGWVRFGGLTGCPAGSCNARVESEGTTYELSGWARAEAHSDSEAGGWDGWISLNCENAGTCATSEHAIRIRENGTFVSALGPTGSFAWGDMNIGWLDFGATSIAGLCSNALTYSCSGSDSVANGTDIWCDAITPVTTTCPNGCNATTGQCNGSALTGAFTVTPTVIRRGQPAQVTWSFPGAGSCDVSGPGTDGITNTSNLGTNEQTTPITLNQATFTLTCDGVVVGTRTIQMLPETYES